MHSSNVSPRNIPQFRQNKPSRVAHELEKRFGIPFDEGMKLMMAHGVCKWLAVRRDLIKYKGILKGQIRELHEGLRGLRGASKEARRRGDRALARALYKGTVPISARLHTLEEVRQALRAFCRSDRWTMPDHDTRGRRWLKRETEKGEDTQ